MYEFLMDNIQIKLAVAVLVHTRDEFKVEPAVGGGFRLTTEPNPYLLNLEAFSKSFKGMAVAA